MKTFSSQNWLFFKAVAHCIGH